MHSQNKHMCTYHMPPEAFWHHPLLTWSIPDYFSFTTNAHSIGSLFFLNHTTWTLSLLMRNCQKALGFRPLLSWKSLQTSLFPGMVVWVLTLKSPTAGTICLFMSPQWLPLILAMTVCTSDPALISASQAFCFQCFPAADGHGSCRPSPSWSHVHFLKIDCAKGDKTSLQQQVLSIWFLNDGRDFRTVLLVASLPWRWVGRSSEEEEEERTSCVGGLPPTPRTEVFRVNWNKPATSGAFCLQK